MAKPKKPSLEAANAIAEIDAIMSSIAGITPMKLSPIFKLTGGKLYELCVYSRLLGELAGRGWLLSFVGPRIELKGGPGMIRRTDPHIELRRVPAGPVAAEVHVDIEVGTLGCALSSVSDLSAYHEIDIVIVPPNTLGRPAFNQLMLGIECKATANFDKAFVREVLGRRRELSVLRSPQDCLLDGSVKVPAQPPSEYWLAFIDPAGQQYTESPAAFGVDLLYWKP